MLGPCQNTGSKPVVHKVTIGNGFPSQKWMNRWIHYIYFPLWTRVMATPEDRWMVDQGTPSFPGGFRIRQGKKEPTTWRSGKISINFHWILMWYPDDLWMYGISSYIWLIFMGNVGKYTIHGSYRMCLDTLILSNTNIQIIKSSKKRWMFGDIYIYYICIDWKMIGISQRTKLLFKGWFQLTTDIIIIHPNKNGMQNARVLWDSNFYFTSESLLIQTVSPDHFGNLLGRAMFAGGKLLYYFLRSIYIYISTSEISILSS